MITIQFITGNKHKFTEASAIIPNLKQLEINLPEIQELDTRKIIEAKLKSAFKYHSGPFIVEDVSVAMDCIGGLPGPLVKWFLQTLRPQGLYELAEKHNNFKVTSICTYGYAQNRDKIQYFEGHLKGTLVPPRGENGFGFDSIFVPNGQSKTQAQMTLAEKNKVSARRLALEQLKTALLQ